MNLLTYFITDKTSPDNMPDGYASGIDTEAFQEFMFNFFVISTLIIIIIFLIYISVQIKKIKEKIDNKE